MHGIVKHEVGRLRKLARYCRYLTVSDSEVVESWQPGRRLYSRFAQRRRLPFDWIRTINDVSMIQSRELFTHNGIGQFKDLQNLPVSRVTGGKTLLNLPLKAHFTQRVKASSCAESS
ncbi:hypothetical protein BBK14_32260 [Parafrankia soli]|uniref:Uncharacterized protein n=1 Tax=Parafrankia soli TaxID=2599596 RepID=A0A1S1R558_9ACTN|nr:hypothetical protein BBK14_32260 [Parafrankia soli]